MKTCKFLFLSILAVVWLSACNEKEEPTLPGGEGNDVEEVIQKEIDESKMIIIDGDTIEVNTEFTDAEFLEVLQKNRWYNQAVFPYIYDGGIAKSIYWGEGYYNMPEPIHYKFEKNGEMNYYYYRSTNKINKHLVTYSVNDKILSINYTAGNGTEQVSIIKVISVKKNCIIFDMDYGNYLETKFLELNNWFNPETAKLRYVWKKL